MTQNKLAEKNKSLSCLGMIVKFYLTFIAVLVIFIALINMVLAFINKN